MSILAKDLGRGCLRSAVIQVISIAVGLPFSLCLLGGILWSVDAFYDQPVILWSIVCALSLIILALPVAIIVPSILLRQRELDSLFVPLGLSGGAYDVYFRQYHGTLNGRQVDVYLQRGPLLQIEVSTGLQTRLGVTGAESDSAFFAGIAGRQPMSVLGSEGLHVYPHDPDWTARLLAQPGANALLRRLTATTALFTRHSVLLRPGAFQLMLSGSRRMLSFDLEPEQAAAWLQDLLALAALAESIPAPSQTEPLSKVEQMTLKMRQRNPFLALWIALGILAVLFICGGAGAALMVFILEFGG